MKKIFVTLLVAFIVKAGLAQYNPAVNSGLMNPAPLSNGIGSCEFNVGNTTGSPLNNLADPMLLTITLSYGIPNNAEPIAAITGTYASKFTWLYDAASKTYQGTQNQIIPGNALGTIKIAYLATSPSNISNPHNGFNVNVTPPAYTNASNTTADDNVASYTYGAIGSPLPIKLAYYNATVINCISSINWKSVTEENFNRYEVEYSKDGINFNAVYKVNGKGGNSIYSLTHNAAQGKAYYRLKLLDIDGKIEYSRIIALDVNCNKGSVLAYPNPASGFINVNITGADNKVTIAQLFNGAGQIMLNKTLQNGTTQLDISKMASGIYQLKLMNSNGTENIKIVKNN